MNKHQRWSRILLLAACLCGLGSAAVLAQAPTAPPAAATQGATPTQYTVRPGGTVSIPVEAPSKPTIKTQGALGSVRMTETAPWIATYTAQANVQLSATDTFVWSDGGDHTVNVMITGEAYQAAAKVLFLLFIVAVLIESGLHVIFNWRPFIRRFSGATKTVVSVVVSFIVVTTLGLDVVSQLGTLFSPTGESYAPGILGKLITALIVSGGSSAVNNVMQSLGIRTIKTAEDIAPTPPRSEGWVSVRLVRRQAIGGVDVLIGDPNALPVAGTISGSAIGAFWRDFRQDPGSFPPSGGYKVAAGSICLVKLVGRDSAGQTVTAQWGPNVIAAGAIIDLRMTL